VIQGYDGVATVDKKHQVVVHAEAFGQPQEHELLKPMVEGTRENFQAIGVQGDIFEKTRLSADAGFHTEQNMKMLFEEQIDGYVADILFRKRDPRFRRPPGTSLRTKRNPASILHRRILSTIRRRKRAFFLLATSFIATAATFRSEALVS
jgi:hypothetical protein